ncbi:Flavin-dependent monooxygenase, oxygenase subunit HsaA [Mycobacteroides abscessus subsp. massiliense]|nr:Flavin-dependent monooxygenase, oxygenase subunit HsaA [Mycobacteroides abscessus subsp. massiliense]
MFCALSNVAAAPAVGMALGTVELFTEKIKTRVMRYSMQEQSKLATAHRRMGHVAAQAESARTLLLHTVRDVEDKLRSGEGLTTEDRVAVRRNCAYIVEVCKQAIGEAVEACGASAQYEDSPLQRHLRDVNTLSTHVVYDTDSAYELFGRVELGLPPGSVAF